MKKSELFFSFLLVPLDFLMIILAGITAYHIRFATVAAEIRPIIFSLPFSEYIQALLLIASAWLIIFAIAGLYSIRGAGGMLKEFNKVVLACSTGFVLIVVLIFIFRELFSSRFIILAGWFLAIFYVSFARVLIRFIQKSLFRYDIGVHKVVLVGNSKTTDILTHNFASRKNSGYDIIKRYRNFDMEAEHDLKEFIKDREIDEIIQSDPNLSKAETLRLFDFADEYHVVFKYAADLLGTKVLQTEASEIAGIPIVEVRKTTLEGWGRIIKRIFDILFSLIFIIIFSPIIAIISLLIKLDSIGPIFYKNERMSKEGTFNLFKFRSMMLHFCIGGDYSNQEEAEKFERDLIKEKSIKQGPIYKIANDPRLTRVGKFIRRWSIDELPQFFNVLIGNMSLVGPRPHQPREVAKYDRHHKKVLTIKPGITGLAQISGRSDLSFEDEVKLDTYYIENWSILFDIAILLRTPLAVLKGRKVE